LSAGVVGVTTAFHHAGQVVPRAFAGRRKRPRADVQRVAVKNPQ
jgi:hypothetical protein